jgi:hypothetical protein
MGRGMSISKENRRGKNGWGEEGGEGRGGDWRGEGWSVVKGEERG